jgi:hypothetical protein
MMGPSHGPRIPRTWCHQTFLCGGMSSHLCTNKDHRMKLTSNRRSQRPMHNYCGNAARHMVQLVCTIWTLPRPLWQSCWVLMCWDTKVASLLHVCVPLTGNKVDSFLQHFWFFLWHLKRITLYYYNVHNFILLCYLIITLIMHFIIISKLTI